MIPDEFTNTLCLLHSTIMNVGSGMLFGFGVGMAATVIGVNMGASIAFVLCKVLLRERVARKVEGMRLFKVCCQSCKHNLSFGVVFVHFFNACSHTECFL